MTFVHVSDGGGFRTPATSELEIYLRIVDGFQLLTFVKKSIVLVVERILHPTLLSVLMSSSIFRHKSRLVRENKINTFGYFISIHTYITQPHIQRPLTFDSVKVVKISFS